MAAGESPEIKTDKSSSDEKGVIAKETSSPSSDGNASDSNNENNNLSDAEGYGSSSDHVFSDPEVADYWRGVYEKAGYENRHRFDPEFKWSPEEERKLLRKIGEFFIPALSLL